MAGWLSSHRDIEVNRAPGNLSITFLFLVFYYYEIYGSLAAEVMVEALDIPAGGAFPATAVRADTNSSSPAAIGNIDFRLRRACEDEAGLRSSWEADLPEHPAPVHAASSGFRQGAAGCFNPLCMPMVSEGL